MGLDRGNSAKQLAAVKAVVDRWTGDPVHFRFAIALLVLAVTILAVEGPLSARLARARRDHREAKELARLAADVRGFVDQVETYNAKVALSPDIIQWQNYVLEQLGHTSATLISLEPKTTASKGPFKVVDMELVAKGLSYAEFVEFIERLERGERLVRVEKLRLERQQASIYLSCTIKGLVKPSARPAAPAAGERA